MSLNWIPSQNVQWLFFMWLSMLVVLQLRLFFKLLPSPSPPKRWLLRAVLIGGIGLSLHWPGIPPGLGGLTAHKRGRHRKDSIPKEHQNALSKGERVVQEPKQVRQMWSAIRIKKKFARRVRALWSPVFAFSDFDDASTGQFAQCFQRVGSNVVGTSSQPPSSDVGDHKHSFGSPNWVRQQWACYLPTACDAMLFAQWHWAFLFGTTIVWSQWRLALECNGSQV